MNSKSVYLVFDGKKTPAVFLVIGEFELEEGQEIIAQRDDARVPENLDDDMKIKIIRELLEENRFKMEPIRYSFLWHILTGEFVPVD